MNIRYKAVLNTQRANRILHVFNHYRAAISQTYSNIQVFGITDSDPINRKLHVNISLAFSCIAYWKDCV